MIRQTVPGIQLKFGYLIWKLFKRGKEGFIICPLRLLPMDFLHNCFQPRVCGFKSCCQPGVTLLVISLVERHVSVFIDTPLHQFRDYLGFLLQFIALFLQG